MNYQLGFCFWLLTFEEDIAEQINKYEYLPTLATAFSEELCRRYDVIPLFIRVAQAAAKEKVVRVNIATLRVGFLLLISSKHSGVSLEPCHESPICQSTHDAGRTTASIRQEPRHAQVVGRGYPGGRAIPY